jgi:hypothetical protein
MRPVRALMTAKRWRRAQFEADRILLGDRVAVDLALEGPPVHPSLRAASIRDRAYRAAWS